MRPVNTASVSSDPVHALQVSSTETPLKEQDFGYNLHASRAVQARTAVSPVGAVSQYSTDLPQGDVMDYRQGSYTYGTKGYYGGVSGWSGTYADDGVEYVNYHPYQMMGQDPVHMMQSYGRYGSSKPIYVEPEGSATYSYANLTHRPAASNDSPNISLSGMAETLPNPSPARVVPSDRLLPQVTGAVTTASYRTDGLPGRYSSKSTTHASTSNAVGADTYSSLNPSYESPVSYPSAAGSLSSSIPHRSSAQADSTAYQAGASSASDSLYATNDHSLRQADDSSTSLSYVYDRDSARRDPQSSSGASTLSNGHVYVPETHHHAHTSTQGYMVSGSSAASQATAVDGATTAGTRRGHSGSSHLHAESHRRSAGSLRGGG